MTKSINIIGNGKSAVLYQKVEKKGSTYTCNLPPFSVPEAKSTFMVDFKMMNAINEGSVTIPGQWIVGFRPKKWCEMRPSFYMKYAPQIKEFFTDLPSYVNNYTDFNCGHMGTYYICKKFQPDEIHMFGFDSIFDFDLYSSTDFYLGSDRSNQTGVKLTNNWRPIWVNMMKEFPNTKFVLYHFHKNTKIPLPENAEIVVIPKKVKKK